MSPLIFFELMKLKDKYQIYEIRIPYEKINFIFLNFFNINLWTNFIKSLVINFLSIFYLPIIRQNNIKFHENFHGLIFSGVMTKKYFNQITNYYKKKSHQVITILLHPGYSSNRESDQWINKKRWQYYNSRNRKIEYQIAIDPSIKSMLDQ